MSVTPRHGDHVFVVRRPQGLPVWYLHHGIFDANDGSVIHFAGEPGATKRTARVRRDTAQRFARGAPVVSFPHRGVRVYPPEEVVRRAALQIGQGGYDLLWNNCEHFATWAKTGVPRSVQAELLQMLLTALMPGSVGSRVRGPMRGLWGRAFI